MIQVIVNIIVGPGSLNYYSLRYKNGHQVKSGWTV
jgi:hypothetical protein